MVAKLTQHNLLKQFGEIVVSHKSVIFFRLLASGSFFFFFFQKGHHDCLLEVQRNRPSAHLRGTFQLPEPHSSCKRKRVCAGLWQVKAQCMTCEEESVCRMKLSAWPVRKIVCRLKLDVWQVEAQCMTGWSSVSDLWGRECGFCHRRQQQCWSCPGAPPWWGCHGGLCPTCPAALSHYDLVSQTTHFNISPMGIPAHHLTNGYTSMLSSCQQVSQQITSPMGIPACCHLTNRYTSKSPHQWVYQYVVTKRVYQQIISAMGIPTNGYTSMLSSHKWVYQQIISPMGILAYHLTNGYTSILSSHQWVQQHVIPPMGTATCHHLTNEYNSMSLV